MGGRQSRWRTIPQMRRNGNDGQRPGSVSSGSKIKWFGWPRQKAVSRLLENLLKQRWVTGSLKVWPVLIGHM